MLNILNFWQSSLFFSIKIDQKDRRILNVFFMVRFFSIFCYFKAWKKCQNFRLSWDVNFINILRTNFSYEHCFGSLFYIHATREKLLKQCLYKKCIRKILMKLTGGSSLKGELWRRVGKWEGGEMLDLATYNLRSTEFDSFPFPP